jgi:hypothetical protein
VARRAAAVIAADPIGQIPRLIAQVGAAIAPNLAANAAVADLTTLVRYAGTVARHTSYGTQTQTAQWMQAMAADLTRGRR